jgi:hypothetical protein
VARIPEGFPARLTDDELTEAIEEWSSEYRTRYDTSTLPELIVAFINTASQEQLRREARAANRVAKLSLVIAGLAFTVSIVSLVVTLSS